MGKLIWDDSRVIAAEKAFDKAIRGASTSVQIEAREAFENAIRAAEEAAIDRALVAAVRAVAAA